MTTITKKIDLNVSQPNNYQLVHAMQGDSNTVEILATIWDGNKMYSIDCDQISLEWQSPSGSKRDYPIAEHTQHTATFLLKKEMLVENGDYAFCIRFDNSDNDVLRTFPSTMRVIQAPFGQLMDSEIVTLTELVNKAKSYYDKLISEKGQPNGIATLDKDGNVPMSQLANVQSQVFPDLICNLLYLPDKSELFPSSGIDLRYKDGNCKCAINSNYLVVWSGEIALPEGGYAYPASSDTAEVIVVYTLDGVENRIEISDGAVLPENAVVTEYRLERKNGESQIIADIYPMISPGKRYSEEFVPYTGNGHKINHCVSEAQKNVIELKKSVSDGKSAVASAITEMGVSTESDAAFETIADNVEKIKPTLTVSGGVSGSWNGGIFTYGGGCGATASINGKNTVSKSTTISSQNTTVGGNAYASDVLVGKTFSSDNVGRNVDGTLLDLRSTDAIFTGNHFSHGDSASFALKSITNICYSKFGLHYTINTSNLGSVSEYADWGCPHVVVTGGGGTINVLRSGWIIDVTNYKKMVVQLYGTTKYVGGSMEFRGCVGVCAKDAGSSTGAEGRDYALRYGEYQFNTFDDHWKDVVVDLSGINQEVQFHMSTVHAGDVYVRMISFVPN